MYRPTKEQIMYWWAILFVACIIWYIQYNSQPKCIRQWTCELLKYLDEKKDLQLENKRLQDNIDDMKIEFELEQKKLVHIKRQNQIIDEKLEIKDVVEIAKYDTDFMVYIDHINMADVVLDEIPQYITYTPWAWYNENKYQNRAYQLWGMDFVLTLHAENQERNHLKQSDCHGKDCWKTIQDWPREQSYWLCQLNALYHSDFLASVYFQDPQLQLIYCYNVYKKAVDKWSITTTLYWYNNRHLYSHLYIQK